MPTRRNLLGAPPKAAPLDRGAIGGYQRLPSVHAEGVLDFLWGVEKYNGAVHGVAADNKAEALMASAGLTAATPVDVEQAIDLFAHDPVIATRYKAYLDSQRLKMKLVSSAYAPHRDHFLDRLDRAVGKGPGTLTLDRDFVVPDYARHELHMQPGGYVGDDLAGYVFRHAIVGLYSGHNFENETHESIAAVVPAPSDGKVRRILDLGCGIGQLALALKERFPDAEVWGIDTSAPMLRYAHLHATELNATIHYAQQSAEATSFPVDHFDIVTASGLFHEIAPEATRNIIGQIAHILRPGGTFYPLDLYTTGTRKPKTDAKSRFATWISARWYHEDWREAYAGIDIAETLRTAGLEVIEEGPALRLGTMTSANIMAVKPA